MSRIRNRSPYSGYKGRQYKSNAHRGIVHGYKSGLEKAVANAITKHTNQEVQYEPFRIPYVVPATYRTYRPDFVLPNGIVVETKGRFTIEDRQKHLLIQQQYPDLDLRFVFSRSNAPIRKGSTTTYAMWCEKYGFKYNDVSIPLLWYEEPENAESLLTIASIQNQDCNTNQTKE